MIASFLNGFKSSDVDQLILALVVRLGVILVKKLDVKFSHVFIRYKDTHYYLNLFCFFFKNFDEFFNSSLSIAAWLAQIWSTEH